MPGIVKAAWDEWVRGGACYDLWFFRAIFHIEEVKAKALPGKFEGYARHNVLVASYEPTPQLAALARVEGVTLITLEAFL